MTSANSLILGLGLFFLGLRLIGENLRRLYGSSFRNVIKRTTHSPLFGAGLGTLAGAVMQSATAVTFILVGMPIEKKEEMQKTLLAEAIAGETVFFIDNITGHFFFRAAQRGDDCPNNFRAASRPQPHGKGHQQHGGSSLPATGTPTLKMSAAGS